jgi:HD-GYP domain-containing protein (c-di-GMP phosphodiesterase class II)
MERFRQDRATPQEDCLLADIIHTTDVFEALTADRSYRKPYTVEEALKVIDGMARDGKVNDAILASLKNNGTIAVYAQAAGLQHSLDGRC